MNTIKARIEKIEEKNLESKRQEENKKSNMTWLEKAYSKDARYASSKVYTS